MARQATGAGEPREPRKVVASGTIDIIGKPPEFHTFCHISEYDAEGYRSLRQMVATSAPITLWSPSSSFFSDGTAGISPEEFVDLIRDRAIRVVGRRGWITDPGWRERMKVERRWKGFAWDEFMDSRIRSFYEFDEEQAARDPNYQRRVVIAGPAPGPDRVHEVEESLSPADRRQIHESVLSNDFAIPAGVKEAARQGDSTAETVVRSVLIDALNHADAYAGTSAKAPFFLESPDSLFLRHLAPILSPGDTSTPDALSDVRDDSVAETRRAQDISRALAAQMLRLLRELEDRTSRRTPNLTEFLKTPGRAALVAWYSDLHDEYQATADANRLDGAILRRLQKVVHREPRAAEAFKEIFSDKLALTLNGFSIMLDVISLATNPDPIQAANMGIKGLSAGLTGLRTLNWIPRNYGERHWPYLYSNGKPPRRHQVREMKNILAELADQRMIL